MSVGVVFDGHDLSEHFYISRPTRPLPDYQPQTADSSAKRGTIYRSTSLGTVSISVPLAAKITDEFSARDCFSWLAGILTVSEPKELSFSDEHGRVRMAIPQGVFSPEDDIGFGEVTVTFLQTDPALYGDEVTVTVPSGSSATFTVSGNTYTRPTITAQATRDAASHVWGLRLDGKDYLHIELDVDSACDIACDCETRTLTVDRTPSLPTLTSDWLTFEVGEHTLDNELGTGAATVTYRERWL